MLGPYIDFVASLFPCISPYTQENAKNALSQFYSNGKKFQCFTSVKFDGICQGDIVSSLPFEITDDDGEIYEHKGPALIISNSCDIENDKQFLAAPLFRIEELDVDEYTLKNNMYYRLLYFPDEIYRDFIFDLGLIQPFSTPAFDNALKEGRIRILHSLNTVGYYLLISKITVHLLRPEDVGVQTLRMI
jgi:3'-phosphoadenosine 5'-phosphosulfate sulfotransferase (PAPS reductase)/FAD synthetase